MSTTQTHQAAISAQNTLWEVSDALWDRLEPILRCQKVRKKPGRPRIPDRAILNGLLVFTRSGGQWKTYPKAYAAKSTAFDRFCEWVERGVFGEAWAVVLSEYDDLIGIEWTWQSVEDCAVKAPLGKKGTSVRRSLPARTPQTGANVAASGMS
jgi:transposase